MFLDVNFNVNYLIWNGKKSNFYIFRKMAVVRSNEYIYVCGGNTIKSPYESLNSVEKYSIETDTWSVVCPMNFKHSKLIVVALGKYLYAMDSCNFDDKKVTYRILLCINYNFYPRSSKDFTLPKFQK